MKHSSSVPRVISIPILFLVILGLLSATKINHESRSPKIESTIHSPTLLTITVPWTEDTTYIDCASDIPPLITPDVSSTCIILDTVLQIQIFFGSCVNKRTIIRTWIFTDSCMDTARVHQVIIIDDTEPPTIIIPWAEDTTYYDCLSEVPEIEWPLVSDNCGVKDTTRSIQTTFGACNNDRRIKRTWIFRDSCDNEARAEQWIFV